MYNHTHLDHFAVLIPRVKIRGLLAALLMHHVRWSMKFREWPSSMFASPGNPIKVSPRLHTQRQGRALKKDADNESRQGAPQVDMVGPCYHINPINFIENINHGFMTESLMLIQEDYFKNIFNTVREAILILDENMRVLSANRSFFTIFKVDSTNTIGSLLYDLGNGQWNIPHLRALLEDVLPNNDTVDDYKIEHTFENIGQKTMLLNARKIAEKRKGPPIILLAIEDITARMEIENGLEITRKELEEAKIAEDEAREFAESVINTVREPLIALDHDLRVVSASRSFYEFFKVKPEETVGQLIYDLGNKQWDIPKLRELLETILPQKATFDSYEVEHDFIIIGKRIMLLNARQIERGRGKERIILLAIEDITERKKAESDIMILNENIAIRNTKLEMLNKELEAFTYSISHDLRAPLRSLSGFSKIIYEDYADRLDTQGKDYLVRIKNGSDRMSQLVEDLLRLSHISLQNIDRMDYDLSGLASAVINSLREADPERSVEVVIAERLRAVVDPNLMRIAFTNLFNNAWKYTSKTENARIEFGSTEKDAKTLYFIKDNGAGFDPTFAEKMFLPFRRLHTEKEFEGTGIGLAIVERIIRRHEGNVCAEGEIGKGATIYFTLEENKD